MIGKKLTPFKFWCQKVLPTVYDDSLSYYEYLGKLNEYLNEVIEQINTLTEAEEDFQEDLSAQWTAYKNGLNTEWLEYKTGLTEEWNTYRTQLTQAWTETKNYIDHYFDNLNVQTEINNKLDAMVLDGTMSELIEGVIGADIPTTVTAWLTEHVDPVGSAVVVDNTLSISGAAADAKVVGEKVLPMNDNSGYSNMFNPVSANLSSDVISSTGELTPMQNVMTSDLIEIDPTKEIHWHGSANRYFYAYDTNKDYLGYGMLDSNNKGIIGNTYATAKYIRLQGANSGVNNVYLMYSEHDSNTYVPYNPVDGNIINSNYVKEVIKNKGRLRYGYFYAGGYLDIDTTASPVTYKIKTNSYILANDGYARNTSITLDTAYTLTGFNINYCTVVYSISNNDIRCLQDYTGDYSDYVILGYYLKGDIIGNLGVILVNGRVSNAEIDIALSDYDIPELTQLESQVNENTTNINVNASAISSEATTRANADTALGARIDNLVAPSGQSIAEVTDARVGYNGTLYQSLEARLNAESGRVRNVLVVGTNGQYQTIASAVSAAQNGDIIFIKRGVYTEHILNRDKELHIIGESKDEVIWKHSNTDYGSDDCYDCGMGSIRNLTMWNYDNGETPSSEYGRSYCVHLDHYSYYQTNPPISNYFFCENVHFINDNNEAVGLGLRENFTAEFINCDFECISGDEAAFYVHSGNSSTITNAKCILKNCTVKNNSGVGEQPALRFEGYWQQDGGCTAVLERNIAVNIGGGAPFEMQKSHHYGSETVENWQGVSDWLLDPRSELNNVSELNYSEQ